MLGYCIAALAGAVFGAGAVCFLIGGCRDVEKVVRCKNCDNRWVCQIRAQFLEDDDFCSLGSREE